MSRPVAVLNPKEAYQQWASTYDTTDNPLIALEERILLPDLANIRIHDALDVGCGTGRWLRKLDILGGTSIRGIDSSSAMLEVAHRTCSQSVKLHLADASMLPLPGESVDFVIASFLLSYVQSHDLLIKEIYRVLRPGGTVVLSDLHPEARSRGWRTTFKMQESTYEIETCTYTLTDLRCALINAGFSMRFSREPYFGDSERPIFLRAQHEDLFSTTQELPAIYILGWTKGSFQILNRN